jgi:hypothetical protein
MINAITPVRRAVIVLDQACGELRADDTELLGLDLWPTARNALSLASSEGLEVILAAPTDLSAEAVSGLSGWMSGLRVAPILPGLRFGAGSRDLAGLSAADPATALVSADRRLRGEAARAGFQPAPHVALLPMMMRGEVPQAVRMVGPREVLARLALTSGLVPMHFQPSHTGDWALIALVAGDTLTAAVIARVGMSMLPYDTMAEDLVWARIDEASAETRKALDRRRILHAEPGQVLIALSPNEDVQALHLHGAHGHTELLVPSPELLRPAVLDSVANESIDAGALPEDIVETVPKPVIDPRILRILRASCPVITASYQSDLDRYTGVTPLDAAGAIASRHSAHPHNKRAEAQLLVDLQAIGYCAYRHDFTHAGQTHSNIIADLPGCGVLRIRPEVLERYRRILRDKPLPQPLEQPKCTSSPARDGSSVQTCGRCPTPSCGTGSRQSFACAPGIPGGRRSALSPASARI